MVEIQISVSKSLHIEAETKWLQTTFSKAFSWTNIWFKFDSNLFTWLKLTINKAALVQVMAWCQTGNKPLSEPMAMPLPGTRPSGVLMWPEPWFHIKMSSYQHKKSHCGDKMILRPSCLHNGISYTDKMTSLYWIRTLVPGGGMAISHNLAALSTHFWGWDSGGVISISKSPSPNLHLNSLIPGRCGSNLKIKISEHMSQMKFMVVKLFSVERYRTHSW